MRTTTLCAILLASASGVLALNSLSGYTKDIPKCAHSALVDGMKQEGCDVSNITAEDFDCLCKHIAAISIIVAKNVDAPCTAVSLSSTRAMMLFALTRLISDSALSNLEPYWQNHRLIQARFCLDFSQAAGSMCARWNVESTTATDLAAATSALANALNGKGSDAKQTATGIPTSATRNIAMVPTGGAIGVVGGLAAAVAGVML
ncbi:hypothetical protein J3459_017887 [Metarhizium acridum]|nr:hypothetical protein J3459_017887 [Metarhizium acridum]